MQRWNRWRGYPVRCWPTLGACDAVSRMCLLPHPNDVDLLISLDSFRIYEVDPCGPSALHDCPGAPIHQCVHYGLGYYRCECAGGFEEIEDEVLQQPTVIAICKDVDECSIAENGVCGNGSVCINTPGSYMCVCPEGHFSNDPHSEPCTDPCSTIVCQNNGTCQVLTEGQLFQNRTARPTPLCRCVGGFSGDLCQWSVDDESVDGDGDYWYYTTLYVSLGSGLALVLLLAAVIALTTFILSRKWERRVRVREKQRRAPASVGGRMLSVASTRRISIPRASTIIEEPRNPPGARSPGAVCSDGGPSHQESLAWPEGAGGEGEGWSTFSPQMKSRTDFNGLVVSSGAHTNPAYLSVGEPDVEIPTADYHTHTY